MPDFDLAGRAREFAGQLADVLNRTVCHGITIRAVKARRDVFKVGYDLKSDDYRVAPIPLTIDAKRPSGYLGVTYSLSADDEAKYLMVRSSVLTYGHDRDTEHPLFHYDYERDKADNYPDAHLQVCAESPAWDSIRSTRGLNKSLDALHLPLGNRRFRPTLEDLVEFLIVENLADGQPRWSSALGEGRERFAELQLRAAIRRRPDVAAAALTDLGWDVREPTER